MNPSLLRKLLETKHFCKMEEIIFNIDFLKLLRVDWVFFLGQFCERRVLGLN